MLGSILGDIIGSPYEFDYNNIKTTEFPLFNERSRLTDDTIMTLAVAEGLMDGYGDSIKTEAAIIATKRKNGKMYQHAGYGTNFFHWLASDKPRPYNSYGNGSAMRVLPVLATRSLPFTGSIADVLYGIPEGLKQKALSMIDQPLMAIINRWQELINNKKADYQRCQAGKLL